MGKYFLERSDDMQAVINISSEGTRLRPLSCLKCTGMLDLCSVPLTEIIINKLKKAGIENIVIITGYMPRDVKEYFKDGEKWGVNISYVTEDKADGVLKSCTDILEEEFLYFSRPLYLNEDIANFISFHKKNGAYISILSAKSPGEGLVIGSGGKVTRIEERRLWNSVSSNDMHPGVYILKKDITRFIPENITVTLGENVLPNLVRAGKSVYAYAKENIGESIRDIASYMRGNFAFLEEKKDSQKGIYIEEGAKIEKGALLEGPCYIAKNCHIHKKAKIGAYSIIGTGTVIHEGTSIKRSIIGERCHVGKDCSLRGCVIDSNVRMGSNVNVYEQAVVGFGTKLGDNCTVRSFVKIWPEKNIREGSVISENIMWGQKKRSRLFEKGKIEGALNIDITPLFCTKLGECIGALCDMGEVGIATDGSAGSMMIRDAITAGLLGMGVGVKDFGEQPLPITRRGVAFYMLAGGVGINVYEKDGEEWAEITLIGKDGIDIEEAVKQQLEDLFEKDKIFYPEPGNIRECEYLFEYKLYYLKNLVGYEKKKCKKKKILLSCKANWGRRLIVSAMSDFSVAVSMYMPSVEDEKQKRVFEEAVKTGGFDLGFIMDDKCERLSVVTKERIIDEETYEVLASLIVMKKYPKAVLYVPVTASHAIDTLAEKYNCTVIRTKTAPLDIMKCMRGEEGYLTDQFIFRFDAVGAVIRLIDFMASEKTELEELLTEVPPVTMAKTIVEMPEKEIEEALGRIRALEGADPDSPEGVKITFDKGWVVVVPDAYKEVCQVVSEGVSGEFARELCDFCVEEMMRK